MENVRSYKSKLAVYKIGLKGGGGLNPLDPPSAPGPVLSTFESITFRGLIKATCLFLHIVSIQWNPLMWTCT